MFGEMERREEEEEENARREDENDEEMKREDDEEEEEEDDEEEGGASADRRDEDEDAGDKESTGIKETKKKKLTPQDRKRVPGIIYLGHIPPRFRPKQLRNLLSVYGEIGRIFLQPEGTNRTHRCYFSSTQTLMMNDNTNCTRISSLSCLPNV